MARILICKESTAGLDRQGKTIETLFENVTETVRQLRTDRHANLFAEPSVSPDRSEVDWYSVVSGICRKITEVDESERLIGENLLNKLKADILYDATKLSSSESENDRRLGAILKDSVHFPPLENVYIVGEGQSLQPVMVNWSAKTSNQGIGDVGNGLTVLGPEPDPESEPNGPPPRPKPVVIRRRVDFPVWWLIGFGWLILALMIAAVLLLAIETCAVRLPGSPNFCDQPASMLPQYMSQASVLQDQIAAVEREVGIARRACLSTSGVSEIDSSLRIFSFEEVEHRIAKVENSDVWTDQVLLSHHAINGCEIGEHNQSSDCISQLAYNCPESRCSELTALDKSSNTTAWPSSDKTLSQR